MRKKGIKAKIARIVLTAAMTLALGIPVCAASAEANAEIARGATQYADFDLTLYSGITVYSSSGQNFANPAVVNVTLNTVPASVDVGIYDMNNNLTSKGTKMISGRGTLTFDPAANYPGQYVRVGFTKNNINQSYRVSGRFYYNGI